MSELVAKGLNNQQVADQVYISVHTVAFHLCQTFRKLNIGSRVELTRVVMQQADQAALPSTRRKDLRTVFTGKHGH